MGCRDSPAPHNPPVARAVGAGAVLFLHHPPLVSAARAGHAGGLDAIVGAGTLACATAQAGP